MLWIAIVAIEKRKKVPVTAYILEGSDWEDCCTGPSMPWVAVYVPVDARGSRFC